MVIKLIELVNNFYRDEVDNLNAFGEFCCFGNYDAMNIKGFNIANNSPKGGWEITNEATMNRLDGTCDSRNILCYGKDDDKDKAFWKAAEGSAVLFVTMIKLGYEKAEILVYQKNLVDIINKVESTIAYQSSSHCEIVAIKHTNSHKEGMAYIQHLQEIMKEIQIQVVKMYTIFAVRESRLENVAGIEEELVDCKLKAVMKDWESLDEFLKSLYGRLQTDGGKEQCKVEVYKTLGGSDILIELRNVSLTKLLTCYKMGELLTHSNKLYGSTFYNVESEILSKERRIPWSNGS